MFLPQRAQRAQRVGRDFASLCIGQQEVAQFQPAQAGFVTIAEGFSPMGGVQHLIDQYRFRTFASFASFAVVYLIVSWATDMMVSAMD
jgi:hypothetical protein